MRNKLNIFLLMLVTVWITSCRSEDTDSQISTTLQDGTWRIVEFYHAEHFETTPYKNYKVVFTVQNTVTASGTNFLVGKWEMNENEELQLDFRKSFLFEKFNAKWKVVSYDDQQIVLEQLTDRLVFEKIQ